MEFVEKEINDALEAELSAYEIRPEDNLYLIGPFWIISDSIEELNKGNFNVIFETFLVDYEGNYVNRVPRSQFTHKGIWENKYKSNYNNVSFDYFPRGRISFYQGKTTLNIPKGLNETLVIESLSKIYDFDKSSDIKYTDPTSGNHYSFQLK